MIKDIKQAKGLSVEEQDITTEAMNCARCGILLHSFFILDYLLEELPINLMFSVLS